MVRSSYRFLFLAIGLIMANCQLTSQEANRFNLELNILRFGYTPELDDRQTVSHQLDYVTGFRLGYSFSEDWAAYTGYRRITVNTNIEDEIKVETVERGSEFQLGVQYAVDPQAPFYFSLSFGLFYQTSSVEGLYIRDYPPPYELDHKRKYWGFVPGVKIHWKASKLITLFAESQYRYGYISLEHTRDPLFDYENFPDNQYWKGGFDVLSALGVRFSL